MSGVREGALTGAANSVTISIHPREHSRGMQNQSEGFNPCLISSLQFLSRLSSTLVFVIGAVVLSGWLVRLSLFFLPEARIIVMKPNTALGFMLCAVSLWTWRRWADGGAGGGIARTVGRISGAVVFLLGILTTVEYIFGVHLHLDHLLVTGMPADLALEDPWRMAAATATAFVFLGPALFAIHERGVQGAYRAQWIACLTFLVCVFGLLDGILNPTLSQMHMPILTVLNIALISLAIALVRPTEGLVSVVAGESFGGSMARRLLPAAIVLSLIIAWLRWKGEEVGYYDNELGVALSTAIQIILLVALIWANAKSLERADQLRKRAEEVARREQEKVNQRARQEISELLRSNQDLQKQLEQARARTASS